MVWPLTCVVPLNRMEQDENADMTSSRSKRKTPTIILTVRAEGAVLARQTASLVGAVELGDPLAPADPEVSLRICYAQPGEELFAIARRYHVSPGQMLAANDLPDGTARLDEARRLLVPGV